MLGPYPPAKDVTMTLPANVSSGYVSGLFMDTAGTLATGTITFVLSAPRILDVGATPPTTLLRGPVVATVVNGTFLQEMVATDDPDLNPTGYTYNVTFSLQIGGKNISVPSFSIAVPASSSSNPVDLTLVAPVPGSGGVYYVRGQGVPDTSTATAGQVVGWDGVETLWVNQTAGSGSGGGPVTADDIVDASTIGRTVLKAADATTIRTDIGALGTADTAVAAVTLAPTADVPLGTHKLTGVKDPTGAQDAATKNYVDTENGLLMPRLDGPLISGANPSIKSTVSGAGTFSSAVVNFFERWVPMQGGATTAATIASWLNEWGALRGTSPYDWGDALVRAIRITGDGITTGNFAELVDRSVTPSIIRWGRRWIDGALMRNGKVVRETYSWVEGTDADPTLGGTVAIAPFVTYVILLSSSASTIPTWARSTDIVLKPSV